jgi:hypothetical protein
MPASERYLYDYTTQIFLTTQ